MTTATTLAFDGELTISRAAEHHAALVALLAEPGEAIELDLGAVQACDSAGIQLLIATRRSLAAQGRALRVARMAGCVAQALRTYGLDGDLPLHERPAPASEENAA